MPTVKDTTLITAGETTLTRTGRTAKQTFLVDYTADGPPSNVTAPESATDGTITVPAIGAQHESAFGQYAVKKTCKPIGGTGLLYAVDVEFETLGDGETVTSPLSKKDTITGGGTNENETIFRTEATPQKPIVTSAGEPFALATRTTAGMAFTIKGNRATIDPVQYATYLRPNAVNSAAVTVRGITFGVGELKIKNISFAPSFDNGVNYYEVTWETEAAPTWDLKTDDAGLYEKDGTLGKLKPILDNTGNPVSAPYPLDGSGVKKSLATDLPAQLTFPIYPKKAFSVFGWTATA